MAAPASEDLRELVRLLEVAAETGERLTPVGVAEDFGVGLREATVMLDTLRENGKAVEVAPGEWEGPSLEELEAADAMGEAEPERVVVAVPADDEEDHQGVLAYGPRTVTPFRGGPATPTVRLTMAIAEALNAEALGQLVKAAIGGLEDGEAFYLEVAP